MSANIASATVAAPATQPAAALEARALVRRFKGRSGAWLTAVDHVNLHLAPGETLGLVGESGCGKSTLAKALLQLPPPDEGEVLLGGRKLSGLSGGALREARQGLQMVFQDPVSSLNPRRRVIDIVSEPLRIWAARMALDEATILRKAQAVLSEVGFDPEAIGARRPHELSGGQCQRVAIARALMLEPRVLVLDEPVSALDVSVQAQILNLLMDLRERRQLSMLFVSHDLAVIRNICDRVAVMYLGRIVEVGRSQEIFSAPRHPYTRALLDSMLVPGKPLPEQEVITGDLPSLHAPPSGCHFRTRCRQAQARCAEQVPTLVLGPEGQTACACFFPLSQAGHAQAAATGDQGSAATRPI